MAQLLKERARAPLAESKAVNGSQTMLGGRIAYRIDLYQSPGHTYSVILTREEMLKTISSWIAGEARLATDQAKRGQG